MKRYKHAASGILVPLAALGFWQLLSTMGWVNATILPSPMQVLTKWWAYLRPLEAFDPTQGSYLKWCFSGELPQDAMGSLYRVLVGFTIGAGLALPLGLVMGAQHGGLRALQPAPPGAAAHPAHRLHPAVHPLVRAGQPAGHLPHHARAPSSRC